MRAIPVFVALPSYRFYARFFAIGLCLALWLATNLLPTYVEPNTELARLTFLAAHKLSTLGLLVTVGMLLRGAGRMAGRTDKLVALFFGLVLMLPLIGLGCGLLILLFITPQGIDGTTRDVRIYRDPRASYHKLILQEYESSALGDTDYRLIEVWNQYAVFRRCRPVSVSAVRGRIPELTATPGSPAAATIYYRGRPFRLERTLE